MEGDVQHSHSAAGLCCDVWGGACSKSLHSMKYQEYFCSWLIEICYFGMWGASKFIILKSNIRRFPAAPWERD